MRPGLSFTAIAASLMLAACASMPAPTSAPSAAPSARPSPPAAPPALAKSGTHSQGKINLSAASGSLVSGSLQLRQTDAGLQVTGEVGGLTPNTAHGFHVHEKGDCSAADASSAGGHFNPTGVAHGRLRQGTHHLGDSDNITSDAKGVAKVDRLFAGLVLGGGAVNDALGKAVIVHADPDDYTSQPSGNAGARVACGIITAG